MDHSLRSSCLQVDFIDWLVAGGCAFIAVLILAINSMVGRLEFLVGNFVDVGVRAVRTGGVLHCLTLRWGTAAFKAGI